MKLMKRISLQYLIALSEEGEPTFYKDLKEKHNLPTANTIMAAHIKNGFVRQQPSGKYEMLPLGHTEIAAQLEAAPLEDHPDGSWRATKGQQPANKKGRKRPPVQPQVEEPPQPELNLSPTALGLMEQAQNVIAENDMLRQVMKSMHDQLGELLYGNSTED